MATKSVRTSKTTTPSAKSVTKAATKTATDSSAKAATKKMVAKTAVEAAVKTTNKPVAKKATAGEPTLATRNNKVTLRGRSVFVVQTTEAGVVVRSAWLSEDKKLQEMPAVFPNVDYAINVLDDLKRQVLKHFSQAAQVGAQAIASQRASKAKG